MDFGERLTKFVTDARFRGKGPLSVALLITDCARKQGLPLDPSKLVTEDSGTQVVGLNSAAVQRILARSGETRILSKEAGRTSRGSVRNMQAYVAFLNELAAVGGNVDLNSIEKFWIEKVREFFAGKPFRVGLNSSRGLRAFVRDLLNQAENRQKDMPGTHYAGTVMQHLVGAKLDCVLGTTAIQHNSYSTSDEQSGRSGDFLVEDVAVHVTTSPGENVVSRCRENLDAGLRAIVVTGQRGVPVAEGLAQNVGLGDRIDIFEIEQFIALNAYEIARFKAGQKEIALRQIVDRYNQVIDLVETDPSLKIEFVGERRR